MLPLASVTILGVLEQGESRPITVTTTLKGAGPLGQWQLDDVTFSLFLCDRPADFGMCVCVCGSLLLTAGNPSQAEILCGSAHYHWSTRVWKGVQSSVSKLLTGWLVFHSVSQRCWWTLIDQKEVWRGVFTRISSLSSSVFLQSKLLRVFPHFYHPLMDLWHLLPPGWVKEWVGGKQSPTPGVLRIASPSLSFALIQVCLQCVEFST